MNSIRDERGSVITLVSIILLCLFLVGALGFGSWAYMGRQDYKKNVDAKIKVAVAKNTKEVQLKDAADFAEASKQPLKPYTGPESFGSVKINYPKTWSAYVVTTAGGQPLDAYFNPDFVPSASDQKSVFALRVQIVSSTYSQTLTQFQGLQKQGKVTVAPYALPKTPTQVGVRIDGQLTPTKQGSMVVLPVRDKTLKLWIESNQFVTDFNNIILPNASFSP
ncbi:hypothetical protein IPL68_04945 [Candidatus Saccharibacteria bacterium]|nr:MAG: hypothetical protein IPL68_04945 [Candidatus Saccharibacteria bacterium]